MRARLSPVTAAALVAASCFQVEPLPDCADAAGEGGLYVRHHVCMPLAGEPLVMPVAPRRLLRGDFDAEGVANDFAVQLDLGLIHVYTTRDQETTQAATLQMSGRIEAITAARYFGDGVHGDDLIGVTAGDPNIGAPGKVFGFHNGGDLFATTTPEVFDAFTVIPPGVCPAPNSVETFDVSGMKTAAGLAIGCDTGPSSEGLDGIVVFAADDTAFEAQVRLGLQHAALTGVHAVNVAQLDGLGFEDIVLAYTPAPGGDHALSVHPIYGEGMSSGGDQSERVDVPLGHGAVSRVLVGDVDGDADIDLVAVHPEGRGISVVRQRRAEPLSFAAPQFFAVGEVIRDAILGDFTGDGEVDIAVAHEVDDTGLNAIAILVRTPDLAPGQVDYALVPAGSTSGEIVDLEPLDYDADGRTDIAAVVKSGSEGRVLFWLNRSPSGE
jgi:hypothetical protein